jgi:hypothetical protein
MGATGNIHELHQKIFHDLKREISILDPVAFAENYLTIDGRPFKMTGNGWKFMADLYREVAAQATSPNSKPVVVLKGRQVGATVLAAVLSLYFTSSGLYGTGPEKPPMRILHTFPTLGIMSKYAKDKLKPMVQGSQDNFIERRALKNDNKFGKNAGDDTLTEYSFVGFNKLRIDSVGRDSDRIRGLTQDGIFFDEVQDMSKEAIENAVRILTAAQYGPPTKGVQLYFGTPKNTGSYFYQLWEKSDQRYYQLGCTSCKEFFFFHTIGSDEWKEIWISGYDIKCPKCGHVQHKTEAIENGRWKATKTGADIQYVGYHLNILLNPRFTKEAVLDYDPAVNRTRGDKSWRNETLGEFYSGGSTPLTMDEMYAHCLDKERGIAKAVKPGTDKTLVMGIDWGGKDYDDGSGDPDDESKSGGQSYTAICILSIDKRGVFTVENAYRLKKNDFSYKIEVLQELYRRFNIRVAAADFFYGQDVVNHMQIGLNYGNRFLGCINSGNLATLLNYKPKELRVTLNKDMMIEEVFSLIRKDKIKFPAKDTSFDALYWLMEHCTSMEVKTVKRNENFIRKYEKGAIPNDGLMAMLYAIVAYKFIATSGFKTVENAKKAGPRPGPMLAFIPNFK